MANVSLSFGVLPINFVSYLKYFLVIVLLLFILLLTPFFSLYDHLLHLHKSSTNFPMPKSNYHCFNRLHIDAILRSSALSINVLLIFYMHDLNGALFLKIRFLFLVFSTSPQLFFLPFTIAYASLQSQKSDVNIDVLNVTFLLAEYWSLDELFMFNPFFCQKV